MRLGTSSRRESKKRRLRNIGTIAVVRRLIVVFSRIGYRYEAKSILVGVIGLVVVFHRLQIKWHY